MILPSRSPDASAAEAPYIPRMLFLDARVPVHLDPAAEPGADAALLVEGEAAVPPGLPVARFTPAVQLHGIGCACCIPRGAVAEALGRLFLARARGEVAFFRSVIARPASEAGAAAIREALASDPLVSGRFRLAE